MSSLQVQSLDVAPALFESPDHVLRQDPCDVEVGVLLHRVLVVVVAVPLQGAEWSDFVRFAV